MQFHQALNPRRIARSLVTVLALTLIETIVAPVVAPIITTPKSQAVEVTYASATGGTDVVVPAGVYSVRITARGGAGGTGGADGSVNGAAGSQVGTTEATFAVQPGDRITIWPGGAGGNGVSSLSSAAGGTGGAAAIPTNSNTITPSLSINGTISKDLIVNGGAGGAAGAGGSSGGGGGGGAATIVAINGNLALLAGGGGGGAGGSGPGPAAWNGTYLSSGSAMGASAGNGGTCGNTDGGGPGGGGGGWQGGAAGGLTRPTGGECQGSGGSIGSNFVSNAGQSTINSRTDPKGGGAATYDFTFDSLTACPTTQQTYDIYTIVQVTKTSRCIWTVPVSVSTVDLFLVGGGGGGAGDGGPGGNGGYALSRTAIAVTPNTNLILKTGYGGAASNWGFTSSAYVGDSTTVQTSTGVLYYALGGQTAANSPSLAATVPTAAANGSFAGGMGGNGPGCFAAGVTGKRGISNYFFGTLNTYAGGGGSGACPNGAATTPGPGVDGGGQGGYASSSTVNQPGSNGTDGTGGGGGGGTATGSGLKLIGGKGGSGVILIRYTTNPDDAFPASLSSSVAGRWTPNELQVLDSSRKGWVDSSAYYTGAIITGSPSITTTSTADGANSTGSSKTNISAAGDTGAKVTFISSQLSTYTVFHVVRYVTGGMRNRIITASNNWLSGHYRSDRYKAAYHNYDWMTPQVSSDYKWLLSSDQLKLYRANGRDISYNIDAANIYNSATTPNGLGINAYTGEESNWQFLDLIAFNRTLTIGEIRQVEKYLSRAYGLTLEADSQIAETDTALTTDGNQYTYTQHSYGEKMNDTFTVESWVNPSSACGAGGGSRCAIFSRENTLLTSIFNGNFWYALYGTSSNWEWYDTGVKAPSNEWHNYTITKRGVANTADSLDVYFDGQLAWTKIGNPYRTGTATFSSADIVYDPNTSWSYVGVRSDTVDRMKGQIDEVKIWKVARTATQILADINSNDATSPLLQYYWDFNRAVGSSTYNIPNMALYGPARSDLIIAGTPTFSDIKLTATNGPYTTLTFPRTYLTQTGGWKVPTGVSTATSIVVGGGGGGGFGTSANGPAGAGGGGGVTVSLTQSFTPGSIVPVQVGVGGIGGYSTADPSTRNGQSSLLGVAGNLTALGGGAGGNKNGNGAGGSTVATGGGSGGNGIVCTGSPLTPSASATPGGTVTSGYNGGGGVWGWGGSGGGARGAATDGTCSGYQAGQPGPGYIDPITNIEYGRGGNATYYSTTSAIAGYVTPNNGWGGIVSYSQGNASGAGYSGSAGTVVVRYLTASKPSFTYPTNAYLNVGMTETFTTNVAADSATALLTRTFRWESTTAGSGGTFSPIKIGTGAANAAFSWVPSDTSTSGSQYLYRVVVTDSDTAGLFYTDTSTAVYAVINPALKVTSSAASNTLAKRINVTRNETFTITLGTPTYKATLSPVIPGITIDTSTAGSVVLRIGDTATVGTWLETLTVTDSVSASIVYPLSITVAAPPNLLNSDEIVKNGLVFNLDAGNSASLLLPDSSTTSGTTWRDLSGRKNDATTGASVNTGGYLSTGCTAPSYSSDNGGVVVIEANSDNCFFTPFTGREFEKSYTFEAWFKTTAAIPTWSGLVSQGFTGGALPISVTIGSMGGSTMYVGFYDGVNWQYANCGYTPTIGAWTYMAGTYDGITMRTYINGSNTVNGSACSTPYTGGFNGNTNTNGIVIGKGHSGGTGSRTFPGSIGSVRLYNVPLTASQILQNYNATKFRFDSSNINMLKPSQKYGAKTFDSLTATSGSDTRTVIFNTGNRNGVLWDTTTVANQINLTLQESLTPGTYLETVTITDSLAQSTYLPIRMTVAKADTLTVYVDTPTALNYTGSQAKFTSTIKSIGAVGLESGTVFSSPISFKPGGTTCATGGYCRVGDIGPAGGVIFIDTSTASSDGRIYEAAPQNWTGSDDLASVAAFCIGTAASANIANGSQVGIGWGDTLTANFDAGCTGGAVQVAADLVLNGYSDWFVPSENEGVQLIAARNQAGLLQIGNTWTTGNWGYWTSTESSASVLRIMGNVPVWGIGNGDKGQALKFMLRPVRAFKPCWAVDTCTSLATTDTPTSAGLYNMVPTTLSNAADLLTKYTNVVYSTTNLTINRVAPSSVTIPWINTSYPDTFTINFTSNAGNQTIRYSTTNGTASGCALDYKKIYTTSQGTCFVTITRAGDRNFLPDTITATIFFLAWVNSQPTNQVGSGNTIAINGMTSYSVDTTTPPSITTLSTTLISLGSGGTFTINGTGFGASGLTVKFWRNKVVTPTGSTATTITFNVSDIGSSGATTGRIAVTTVNGQDFSTDTLTITP